MSKLPTLNAEELDAVINHAKALKANGLGVPTGKPATTVTLAAGADAYDYVLDVLAQVCKERGRDIRNTSVLKRSRAYRAFRTAAPRVVQHIETFAPGRAHVRAVLRLAYSHMVESAGMGAVLLMNNTDQIPRVLDELFPGYYAQGLMHVAVGALKG